MKRLNQSGSHIVAIAVLVLALGVVGFAGYKVKQAHDNKTTVASQAATMTTAKATVPGTITSSADLQQAGQALDQSSAQLNAGLDDSSLNSDLNSML